MIFFNCNYCDELETVAMQDPRETGLPIQKIVCKKCGKTCWLVHSRIDPVSYKDEDVSVDEETKTVTIKEPRP